MINFLFTFKKLLASQCILFIVSSAVFRCISIRCQLAYGLSLWYKCDIGFDMPIPSSLSPLNESFRILISHTILGDDLKTTPVDCLFSPMCCHCSSCDHCVHMHFTVSYLLDLVVLFFSIKKILSKKFYLIYSFKDKEQG